MRKKHFIICLICLLVTGITIVAEMPLVVFADEEGSDDLKSDDDKEADDSSDDEDEEEEEDSEKESSSSSTKASSTSKPTTNDAIKKNESAISEAETQKNKLQSGITGVKQILASLEGTKKNLKNYVYQLDSNLNDIEAKLSELSEQMEDKQAEIKKAQKALEEAQAKEEEQYASMKDRIRFMYEKRDSTYLEMILSSTSFGDFLNKTEYITKISNYDQAMLKEMIETKNEVAALEEQLKKEQEELEQVKAEIEEDQDSVETLISAKQQEIQVYDADIDNKEKLVKEYEAEIAAQNALIKDMEAAIAAEKKRLQAENGTVITYDGGQFAFPAPSYTRVSDDYGNRIHPTLGVQQFHNGVDLAAPSGSPILAAYDGTVVAAAYSATMGNYIMIDHGDGLLTIYMHASSLAVSTGTSVSRGQRIGSVGSTGRSTGPHLHFSVRLNGSYVSPWNYLKS